MKTQAGSLNNKSRPLLLGVGELLWDLLPGGKQLGGAPANFVYHVQAFGADALLVSRVGDDSLGREILERFRVLGLRTEGLTLDASAPTGTVGVTLDAEGKPDFTIHENVAWDHIESTEAILREATRADAICFGSLAQRSPASRAAIGQLLAAAPSSALRIFDINLRQHFWSPAIIRESLQRANVLKLNDEELPVVARLFRLDGDEESQMRQLAEAFELKAVAFTKGAAGSALLVEAGFFTRPGSKLVIADTVGAGDSYTAALALGLLAGDAPPAILAQAHRVADFVCTRPGAMPPYGPDSTRLR